MARARKIGGEDSNGREAMRPPASSRARATARSTRFTSGGIATDGGMSVWRVMTRPSALFLTSLFAFFVVAGMSAWENGWFDPMIGPRGAGPIEPGPVRFAPRARPAAKEYVAAPAPVEAETAAPEDAAADGP